MSPHMHQAQLEQLLQGHPLARDVVCVQRVYAPTVLTHACRRCFGPMCVSAATGTAPAHHPAAMGAAAPPHPAGAPHRVAAATRPAPTPHVVAAPAPLAGGHAGDCDEGLTVNCFVSLQLRRALAGACLQPTTLKPGCQPQPRLLCCACLQALSLPRLWPWRRTRQEPLSPSRTLPTPPLPLPTRPLDVAPQLSGCSCRRLCGFVGEC